MKHEGGARAPLELPLATPLIPSVYMESYIYLYHVWAHHTENCLHTQNRVSTCRVLSTATWIHMKSTIVETLGTTEIKYS